MEAESSQPHAGHDGAGTGERVRNPAPGGSRTLLPAPQSRAVDVGSGRVRYLVYGIATRAIAHAQGSQKTRRTPSAQRQADRQGQRLGGLEVAPGIGIYRRS